MELDTNNDGMVDAKDAVFADVDSDGAADSSELSGQGDSDGDGVVDYLILIVTTTESTM